jgi:prepilin-type N-terminal cleavage/methylation domain-containing protein/prepilin-type processing-associated H-X9-DG protein
MRRKGFTLIELLVVIAIIAILAAILFPVFSRAREQARKSACVSNVKQLAQGLQMYCQDWDEHFPNWSWSRDRGNPPVSGNPGTPLPWYLAVYPYVKNQGIFVCASDNRCPDGGSQGRMCCEDCKYQRFPLSYGINEAINANCCNFNALPSIKYPAETWLIADSRSALGCGWPGSEPASPGYLPRIILSNQPPSDACGGCLTGINLPAMRDDYTRHTGGSVLAFADGHVKWMKWDQIKVKPYGGTIINRPADQ